MDIEKIDLKNTSATQKAAKKIVQKYKNLKRKAQLVNYKKLKKSKDDDIVFIKQVPVYPRDRLKKLAAAEERVEFIKSQYIQGWAKKSNKTTAKRSSIHKASSTLS